MAIQLAVVDCSVAASAQRDEIVLRICAGLAAALDVVDLESGDRAANLALPSVPLQDFLAQALIACGIDTDPRALG